MNIIANSGISSSSFSNFLPSSTSMMSTVKKSALLVLVVATLPTAESAGAYLIDGIVAIARVIFPYITYAGCLADCLRLADNPPTPWWTLEACKRGCETYNRNPPW